MQQLTEIKDYIEIMCQQIRWKKSHSYLSQEIENHIIDQKNAFLKEGMSDEVALNNALNEMGDPVIVGTELDRTHRPKHSWGLFALITLLLCLGIAIRTFMAIDIGNGLDLFHNIIGVIVGLVAFCIAYFLDFTIIGKYSKVIYFATFFFMLIAIPFSPTINGTSRFIIVSFPYSQFLILIFPVVFSGIIYSMRNRGYMGIIFCYLYLILPLIVSISLGGLMSISFIMLSFLIMMAVSILSGWFSVNKLKGLIVLSVPLLILLLISIVTFNAPRYILNRLLYVFNPSLDPEGRGYLPFTIQNIIENSKFIGEGSLNSIKNMYQGMGTEFLLTYLIHRGGFIVFLVIVCPLVAFVTYSLILVKKQKSILGKLVSFSIILTLAIQSLIYITGNLGLIIFSPVSLPLITSGNTQLTINMFLIGILLSVFRTGSIVNDSPKNILTSENRFIVLEKDRVIINFKSNI